MSLDVGAHGFAQCGDVRLHYIERRPAPDAPLVVLLHGLLASGSAWRHQLAALGDAGYRVVAPDLRGYGSSDKPTAREAYRIERLADDVSSLIGALGASRACIVGHDWGGLIAWWHAMRHPREVESLSILNCPHPAHEPRMLSDPAQLRRLKGLLAMLLPRVPEWRLTDPARLRALVRERGELTVEEVERCVEVLDPHTITAALNYPRAYARRRPSLSGAMRPIDCPTQVLWGEADPYLRQSYADPPTRWVWDVRLQSLQGRGHWLPLEAPAQVNQRLLGFLPPARRACAG